MAFPFSHKNKISLITEDELDENKFNNIIYILTQEFNKYNAKDLKSDKNSIEFISKNSLLGIEYPVKINYSNIKNNYEITYEIDLDKLIKVTLLLIIFAAFFSFLSVSGFLIFTSIFTITFFAVNLFFINSFIERVIIKVSGSSNFNFEGSEVMGKKQEEWFRNPLKCSACGTTISDLDLDCPECGLKIRNNRYTVPLDTSKYQEKSFTYHYKE